MSSSSTSSSSKGAAADAKNEVPEEDEDLSSYAEDVESNVHTDDDADESMGSLKDFIASDDDEDGDDDDMDLAASESDDEEEEELEDFSEIDPRNIVTGKRSVKQVQKFVPEGMEQLLLTKGGAVEIEHLTISSSDEEESSDDDDNSIHLDDQEESEYSPSSDCDDDD